MEENYLVYPFNPSFLPYLYNARLLPEEMRISQLVSPEGWGFTGDRIAYLEKDMIVSEQFEHALDSCSAVWFIEDDLIPLDESILFNKLHFATDKEKNIFFMRRSSNEQYCRAMEIIPQHQRIQIPGRQFDLSKFDPNKLYKINVPVLFVMGTAERTDKYHVQLALRNAFLGQGYKVSSISSRQEGGFVGLYPLPEFITDQTYTTDQKVLMYNHFVKMVEIIDEPELMIIGIPGGVLPLDDKRHNFFGEIAYEICSAVSCDVAVLCSLYAQYHPDYFPNIARQVELRFGVTVDYHHVAACMDYQLDLRWPHEIGYFTLNPAFVSQEIGAYNTSNVFNLLPVERGGHGIEALVDSIVTQLSCNDSTYML